MWTNTGTLVTHYRFVYTDDEDDLNANLFQLARILKAEIEKLLPNDINYHLEMDDSNMLMYGSLNTENEVDNIQSEENIDEENQEDNMIENSLFQEDVLNLPDCL